VKPSEVLRAGGGKEEGGSETNSGPSRKEKLGGEKMEGVKSERRKRVD